MPMHKIVFAILFVLSRVFYWQQNVKQIFYDTKLI